MKRGTVRAWLVPLAALWLSPGTAGARIDPAPLLESLGRLSTFKADFVQTLHVPDFDSIETAAGTLFVARPDRFLLNFSRPAGDMMLADGTFIWIYSADNRQAIKQRIEHSSGFRTFLLDFEEAYDLEVIDTNDDGRWKVRLIPKIEQNQVKDLLLWFDSRKFLLRRLEYVDLNLNRIVYQFDRIEVDLPMNPDRFQFRPPPGTEIFDDL